MWESQVLLTDGQVVFLRVLRFSPTFDERSARYKWNILERAVKPKSKKKTKKHSCFIWDYLHCFVITYSVLPLISLYYIGRVKRKKGFENEQKEQIQIILRMSNVSSESDSVLSNYSVSGQWMSWSDCADALADLSLRSPHIIEGMCSCGSVHAVLQMLSWKFTGPSCSKLIEVVS